MGLSKSGYFKNDHKKWNFFKTYNKESCSGIEKSKFTEQWCTLKKETWWYKIKKIIQKNAKIVKIIEINDN